MARLSIRYFVARPRKDGTLRYYWQPDTALRAQGWKMRRLNNDRAVAMNEAEAINQQVDQARAGLISGPVNEAPGTLDALIAAYKKSRHYLEKKERTRKDYAHYLNIISAWAGSEPATIINARMVQDLYETLREKKPRKAAYLIQVLRLLFSFAEDQAIIPKGTNPASRPKISYRAGKGTLWSRAAVAHFVATADAMDYYDIGTAVMLNEWMGQRRGDLVRLPLSAYRDGTIYIRQSKTGAEVALPVDLIPELKARIEQQITRNKKKFAAGTTLFQQQTGRPYSADGFMSAFERVRAEAAKTMPEIKTLVFKDLRHTAVTRMAEAGATIQQVASVTGHTFKSCEQIIDRYNIRTTEMARAAFTSRRDAINK